jgi:hypothetical protein
MKIIGIVGSRRRNSTNDRLAVERTFFEVYKKGDWICSGGCPKGGDRFAELIAREYGIPILSFYPNWRKYGKRAGFVRNIDIAMNSDILIACVTSDRTSGTENCIKHFLNDKEDLILVEE